MRAAERISSRASRLGSRIPSAVPAVLKAMAILALVPLGLFAPVLAALLATAIVLLGWAPALTDLLAAVRPLVLPLVVVALVGGVHLAAWQQVVLGVTIGLALIPWAASDWARSGRVVERAVRGVLLGVPLVLIPIVFFSLVALLNPAATELVGGAIETWDEFGGLAITLALLAFLAWGVAMLLRLGAYMASLPRAIVAILLLAAGIRLLMEQKLLGGESTFDWLSASEWIAIAGVSLIVVVGLETISDVPGAASSRWARLGSAARWIARRRTPGRWHDRLLNWGLGLAIGSAVVLAVALAWSAIEVRSAPTNVSGHVGPDAPAARFADMGPDELAETFMPVLVFSHDQRWLPQSVDSYVASAELQPSPPPDTRLRHGLPDDCPAGLVDPCYHLACPSADAPCAQTEDLSERHGRYGDGMAYVRIAPVRDEVPAFGSRVRKVLQYWFFYPFDEWRAPVAGGRLVQRHAGDWEAVTIGLGAREPLFLALSQHCGGRWYHWRDVIVSDDPTPRTHPLVGVAVGSHANYQRAEGVRAPDWTSCRGVPGEAVELLTYTWNIRDRTDDDWELLPASWDLVSDRTPPMAFPGTWGAEDVTELKALVTRVLDRGDGPRTPTRQPLWTRPMQRIFCEGAWRGPTRARCPEARGAADGK